MKKDNLFIGIGQGGSNIAFEMQKRNFTSFYINTTIADIKNLEIEERFLYHIPAATGCARNRNKALEYTKKHFNTIDELINTNFSTFKNIFICFASAGGTGSGISPALLSILSKKYTNKNFGAICILPSSYESLIAKKNAYECYNQLKSINTLKNIYFIDNNSYKTKKEINEKFANIFEQFIVTPNLNNIDGNIDDDEIQRLISLKGNVVLGTIENDEFIPSNIFAKPLTDCKGAFIVHNNPDAEINCDLYLSSFVTPTEFFSCVSKDIQPYAGVFGMSFPVKRLEEIIEEIEKDSSKIIASKDNIASIEDISFEMPDFLDEFSTVSNKKRSIDNVDLDAEFDKFFN